MFVFCFLTVWVTSHEVWRRSRQWEPDSTLGRWSPGWRRPSRSDLRGHRATDESAITFFPVWLSCLTPTSFSCEQKLKPNSPEASNVTVKEAHLAPSGLWGLPAVCAGQVQTLGTGRAPGEEPGTVQTNRLHKKRPTSQLSLLRTSHWLTFIYNLRLQTVTSWKTATLSCTTAIIFLLQHYYTCTVNSRISTMLHGTQVKLFDLEDVWLHCGKSYAMFKSLLFAETSATATLVCHHSVIEMNRKAAFLLMWTQHNITIRKDKLQILNYFLTCL